MSVLHSVAQKPVRLPGQTGSGRPQILGRAGCQVKRQSELLRIDRSVVASAAEPTSPHLEPLTLQKSANQRQSLYAARASCRDSTSPAAFASSSTLLISSALGVRSLRKYVPSVPRTCPSAAFTGMLQAPANPSDNGRCRSSAHLSSAWKSRVTTTIPVA